MPIVNLSRYMGRWHEIARFPKWYERGCRGVTADYSLRPDGDVDVLNTCRSADGRARTAHAKAWAMDASGSRFRVRFFWPFSGEYWIVLIDPDYRWAVVGNGAKSSLWILARSPALDPSLEGEIMRRIKELGYDVSRLERGG